MAKKKINEDQVFSELSGSRFFHPSEPEEDDSTAQQSDDSSVDEGVDNAVDNEVDSRAGQPVDQSTDKSTSRQASEPGYRAQNLANTRQRSSATHKTTASRTRRADSTQFDNSPVLSRPKSFYITKNQDSSIDEIADRLSEKLEGKIAHKIDRSVVVRLILESEDWTSEETIDALAKHLVNKLVSQLVD